MSEKKKKGPRKPDARSVSIPKTYFRFAERFPRLAEAHRTMTDAAVECGPLDRKTCELIKIGIALGAGHETSFHSHVRRALEQHAIREEIEQAVVLAMSTCGFSRAVAGWKWAQSHF
jgi:4-carboxymuconolactone decarboxylase